MELTIEQALQRAVAAHKEGKLEEAERLYRSILQSQPLHPDANHNLGVLSLSVNKADAVLPLFKTALEANPKIEQFWLSYINALIEEKQFDNAKQVIEQGKQQGVDGEKLNSLKSQLVPIPQTENANSASPSQQQLISLKEYYQNGRLSDAEELATSITQKYPTHPFSWKVLGAVLKQTGRTAESLTAMQTSAQLAPQDAEAHSNLGATLQELGRLDEAEASYRQAIFLKPDFAEAHSNLGATLKELGRLDEAEASYLQAIALKPDYAEAHSNLCRVLYQMSYKDSALKSIENANEIDPESKKYKLILSVIKSRKAHWGGEVAVGDTRDIGSFTGLTSNLLTLHRAAEAGLITKLYEMNSTLKKKIKNDARFGTRSSDFNLFEDPSPIIQTLAADLTRIIMEAVKSEIYIYDSFFNILGAGGGTTPHRHLNELDKDIGLNLGKQKYSLQYYLSVGDQNCSEPGMLKLYEPAEDILPGEGMITIIPASRMHSAVYNGKTDRVMIGVNFYSL